MELQLVCRQPCVTGAATQGATGRAASAKHHEGLAGQHSSLPHTT